MSHGPVLWISTELRMIQGQKDAGEPDKERAAVALVSITRMIDSAIGLRSWSCGGLIDECKDAFSRKA